jgi:hypothetical protein
MTRPVRITRVSEDEVSLILDRKDCATLSATLHFLGSPLSPYRKELGIQELQLLADALFEFWTSGAMEPQQGERQ